jgi:hypothetical protein
LIAGVDGVVLVDVGDHPADALFDLVAVLEGLTGAGDVVPGRQVLGEDRRVDDQREHHERDGDDEGRDQQ